MIVEVARGTGRSLREVADDSYAVTLYTFLQMQERSRIDRLLTEGNRIDQASLVAFAFHEPKKLAEVADRFRTRIRSKPSREDAMKRAALLMMRVHKAEKQSKRRKAKG